MIIIHMLAWLSICIIFAFLIFQLFITQSWRKLIWENKSQIFRIVKQDEKYYPEKRFLWFFFVRMQDPYGESKRFWSKEEARDYIQKFQQDLKEKQLTKRELINLSNLKTKKEEEI